MKQTAGWKQFGIADIFRRGKMAWAGVFGGGVGGVQLDGDTKGLNMSTET